MSKELTIVITIEIKEGLRDTLINSMAKLLVQSRKSEGCINITVHENNANPLQLLVYETWESEQLWHRYLGQPFLMAFSETTKDLCHTWDLKKYTRLSIHKP